MSLLAAVVAGGVVGVGHALEADHLAAVATLVDEEERHAALVGASWGVGHAVPVVAVGLTVVLVGVSMPAALTRLFEAVVGLVLVGLGVRTLAAVRGVGVEAHRHGTDVHAHLRVAGVSLGRDHRHLDAHSLAVGVLHGFAGSGALVVALASTAPSVDGALAFLAAFALLSTATMGAVSTAWGRLLGSGVDPYLRGTAGVASVVVGVALVATAAGVEGALLP